MKGPIRLLLSYLYTYTLYTQCLSIREWLLKFSDCSCDWQMGKKKGRGSGKQTHAKRSESRERGRDSEDEESETIAMSGTSSDKRRLAQTREDLREAGEDALRMAAAHETPTETPTIFGPGNLFDEGDEDEIEELRTQNAGMKRKLRKHDSTTGAATSKRVTWNTTPLKQCPLKLLLSPNPRTFCPFGNTYLIGLDFIPCAPLGQGGTQDAHANLRCCSGRS
jgi:hypothetical protein